VLLDDYKQFFAENQEVLQREFNQNAAAVAQDKKAFQQKVEAGIHLYLVTVLSLGITAGMTALREVMLKKGVKREHADHTIDALLLLSIAVTSPDITPTLIGYAIQSFIDIFSKAERKPYLKMAAGVGLLMMTSDSLFSLYGLLKFSLTTAASVLATNIVTPYISEFFKSKPEASANNQHVVSMQKYGQ